MIVPPRLSVIVVAHDRRDFIKLAIDSALDQSFPRDRYEIVVVKNFSQQEYDHELERQGIRVIITDEKSLASKLALGIENSEGEIISFLEDDDLFCRDKIESVIENMSKEKVGYYHNGYSIVDSKGKVIKGYLPYVPKNYRKNVIVETTRLTTKSINKAFLAGGYFNLSCISVKKSVIAEKLKILRGVNVAVDNFIFYLALESGLEIIIDNSQLTRFRVHAANNSIAADKNRSVFTSNKIKFFEDDMNGLLSIMSAVKNNETRNYLSCRIFIPLLSLSLLKSESEESRVSVRKVLNCAIWTRSKQLVALIVLNLISRVIRNFGTWFFFYYESKKIKKLLESVTHNF